jgi:DNA-binding HxlR family transcriptional regulator
MPHRSYDHYCAVARALDHLGERWALLIVRELLGGPRRYSDLLADLPGISTDVLATRLRELEADGVVVRAQGGPRTYQLTEAGTAAAPVLDALADWGLHRLATRSPGDAVRGHWLGVPLARKLSPLAASVAGTVQIHLNDAVFHLRIGPDGVHHHDGPAAGPGAVLTLSPETAAALAAGRVGLRDALAAGEAKLEGPEDLTKALVST